MKKQFSLFALSLLLACFANVCFAQGEEASKPQKAAASKWTSDKGYWVIEGNVHKPKTNIVYFYRMDNTLVYKEKIEGMKIRVNKMNVCMRLKDALEQAVTVWEATHVAKEDEMLVAVALKK